MDINLWKNLNKVEFKENFYLLGLSNQNTLLIKKLFLSLDIKSKINSNVLGYGLIGAVTYFQEESLNLILDIAKKLSIDLLAEDVSPAFNLAVHKNHLPLLEILNNNTSIIEKCLKQEKYLLLNENGVIELVGGSNGFGSNYDAKEIGTNLMKEYRGNIFEYICNHHKEEAFSYILSKDFYIEPTLIEQVFLDSCSTHNIKTIVMLLLNDKTKEIIEKSEPLKLYLNESTENSDFKKEVITIINNINLKIKLDTDFSNPPKFYINKKI